MENSNTEAMARELETYKDAVKQMLTETGSKSRRKAVS